MCLFLIALPADSFRLLLQTTRHVVRAVTRRIEGVLGRAVTLARHHRKTTPMELALRMPVRRDQLQRC